MNRERRKRTEANRTSVCADSRGVSEVLGYVFVFAIVISSVGLLYISGVGTVSEVRDAEQINNADRAFIALSANFDDIHRGRAPRRAGEVRLGGGTLRVDESSGVAVDIVADGDVVEADIGEGALVYQLDGRAIRYESSAVFNSERSGSVIRDEPAFRCDATQTIVSTISIETAGNVSTVQKEGTVLVVAEKRSSTLVYPGGAASVDQSGTKTVRLTPSSPVSDAWGRYLVANGWTETGDETGIYECTSERVHVRDVTLTIKILP